MNQVTDHDPIGAVVCVPTFRRPDWLAQTLKSLSEQETDIRFAIVVVDNDAKNPQGTQVARRFFEKHQIPNVVAVEENQGNCFAINRAFGEALLHFPLADHFLMIDDDEIAMPNWLAEMISTAEQENVDVVGGPVVRQFEANSKTSVRDHQLFLSIDGPTRPVSQIHGSGNCLIRRRVFEKLGAPF
ncbi:MAG: glycosyltransferase family 2 protein, partial [Pseudomonadota bacterium]